MGAGQTGVSPVNLLPASNFRLTELQGALLLAQLSRLDRILADTAANKQRLGAGIEDVLIRKGVAARRAHDPQGDTSIALVLLLPDANVTHKATLALRGEGAPALQLFDRARPDPHVYCFWEPLFSKASWSTAGEPWRSHPRPLEYDRQMCPETLNILSRCVHLDVSPDLQPDQVDRLADAVTKVLDALL